jgi:hypothetical protein
MMAHSALAPKTHDLSGLRPDSPFSHLAYWANGRRNMNAQEMNANHRGSSTYIETT